MTQISAFVDKLKAGEIPSDADWVDHLLAAHRDVPGRTPLAFASLRTLHRQNSYEILAEVARDGDSVLDLACGDGHLIPYLLNRVGAKGQVTGIDMSEAELERARSRILDPRVRLAQGMAQSLPFQDAEFDIVLCHLALMLMRPVEPALGEIRRVLRPGGVFAAILAAPADDDFLISLRELCLEFINRRLPARKHAPSGDARVGSLAGLSELFSAAGGFERIQIRDIHFQVSTTPDGAWQLMRGMYFVGLVPPEAQAELGIRVIEFARRHARFGRELRFEFPMRLVSVRRPRSDLSRLSLTRI